MSEVSQNSLSESKKRLRNFAALYAIIVPSVGVTLALVLLTAVGGSLVLYGLAALILISSFAAGVWSLFGRSVQGAKRGFVLAGMLVSGVCGGIAFSLFLLVLLYYR
jgi:hypothetical protein